MVQECSEMPRARSKTPKMAPRRPNRHPRNAPRGPKKQKSPIPVQNVSNAILPAKLLTTKRNSKQSTLKCQMIGVALDESRLTERENASARAMLLAAN
eukprot:1312899-Pyramimonas_sp.AAC.1